MPNPDKPLHVTSTAELPADKVIWLCKGPDGRQSVMTDEPPNGMGWSGYDVIVHRYELVETFISVCSPERRGRRIA